MPWGLVLEDFLEPHGLTLETFCTDFRGSWLFGYVEALRSAGVRTVIVCISSAREEVSRGVHEPSGAPVIVLPAPRGYRALRRRMANPYGRSARTAFGLNGVARVLEPILWPVVQVAPYLSTPRQKLTRALREETCSAILCQDYELPRFDACAGVSRRAGIPLFGVFQGGDYRRWRTEALVRTRAMRRCRGLIVAPAAEARRVVATYRVPADRIARIPNPVDVGAWRPGGRVAARERLSIPSRARVVVWHGRLHVWKKGLDVLLDAWEQITERVEGAHLLLVGDGPDRESVAERARGLNGVTLVDRLVHDVEELRDHLAAGDVYAFPSRHEGFAVAPVEAMAVGLPLVATDVGGIAETLPAGEQSGGVVVPQEDAAALGDALARLLLDPDLTDLLGTRARQRAVDTFSYEAIGSRLAAFLGS